MNTSSLFLYVFKGVCLGEQPSLTWWSENIFLAVADPSLHPIVLHAHCAIEVQVVGFVVDVRGMVLSVPSSHWDTDTVDCYKKSQPSEGKYS